MTPREPRPGARPSATHGSPASRLHPIRDTGISVGGRHRSRKRRRNPLPVVAILAALGIAVALLAAAAGNRATITMPVSALSSVAATTAPTTTAQSLREPTQVFAAYRSLNLRLPIDPSCVTALAFHQASGDKSFQMDSLVPDADMAQAAKVKAVATGASAETTGVVQTVWQGSVLRLWRSNRRGKPDTAADVGADAGTDVYAPVSGIVAQIRAYKLYEKYPDYEIHITPDGWPEIDLVMLHVDDLSIAVGDRVVGGATRIACVRKMSDKIDIQLGGYTKNGGDHVHMQLNRANLSGKLEASGGS